MSLSTARGSRRIGGGSGGGPLDLRGSELSPRAGSLETKKVGSYLVGETNPKVKGSFSTFLWAKHAQAAMAGDPRRREVPTCSNMFQRFGDAVVSWTKPVCRLRIRRVSDQPKTSAVSDFLPTLQLLMPSGRHPSRLTDCLTPPHLTAYFRGGSA